MARSNARTAVCLEVKLDADEIDGIVGSEEPYTATARTSRPVATSTRAAGTPLYGLGQRLEVGREAVDNRGRSMTRKSVADGSPLLPRSASSWASS
jgi:hypothetical protein